jgi:ABC-type microcin C transport system permease subunit YejB
MKPWTPSFFLPVLVLVLLGGCSKASFYPLAGSVGGATVGALGGPGPAAGGAALGS